MEIFIGILTWLGGCSLVAWVAVAFILAFDWIDRDSRRLDGPERK